MFGRMSASRTNDSSLPPAERLLVWAFVASLAFHLAAYGCYHYGARHGWLKINLLPSWFKPHLKLLTEIKKQQLSHPTDKQNEIPLTFVEVDPTQVADAPKNAKYYSSRNSRAANPDISIDSNTPKVTGTQIHEAKTKSAPLSKPVPLQPIPAKLAQPEQAEAKAKPKGGPQVGDLAFAKPADQPGDANSQGDTGQAQTPVHHRPRTLAEAEAQKAIVGEKMKQDGGVKRLDVDSSLNAIATPFGEYDREVIEAIKDHWYALLDSKEFARDRTGRVVVEFDLNYDGRVTNLRVIESNVGDLLSYVCKSAIMDPAPFAPWPSDMRRFLGSDVRDVRFTFFYE